MMKSKLMKAFILGIGMSAFVTNMAFAQAGVTTASPPTRGEALSDDQIALYAKQKDIDQYLFADHADEIAKIGFTINYTGVTGDSVEIGISPYTVENADYLYGLFGKEGVSVVESAANVIYATGTGIAESGVAYAEPGTAAATAEPGTAVNPTDDTALPPDSVVGALPAGQADPIPYSGVGKAGGTGSTDPNAAGTLTDTADSGQMSIQIESTDPAALAADSSVIYETTAVDAGQPDSGTKTVSAADNANSAPSNEGKDNAAADTSMLVLAIAGGAVLIGGGIMAANKKKATGSHKNK